MSSVTVDEAALAPKRRYPAWTAIRRNPTIFVGAVILAGLVLMAVFAPLIAGDPLRMSPVDRLRPPSAEISIVVMVTL